MPKRRKASALDLPDQHSQRPWTDFKLQQQLQEQNHSEHENRAARRACRRLVTGDYVTFEDLFGAK